MVATHSGMFTHTLQLTGRATMRDLDRSVKALTRGRPLEELVEGSVKIDLSKCRFLDLDATLRLIPLLAQMKQLGNTLRLYLPEIAYGKPASSNTLWSYFLRWKFFDAIRKHVDDPENMLGPHQLDYLYQESRYGQATITDRAQQRTILYSHRLMAIHSLARDPIYEGNDQVVAFVSTYQDRIIFRALTIECGFDDDAAEGALSFIASEAVLNAVEHAMGSFAVLAMQLVKNLRDDSRTFVLTIADDGIGIPDVLRRARAEAKLQLSEDLPKTDKDLLILFTSFELARDSLLVAASVSAGTTSNPGREGFGLYFLRQQTQRVGGRLVIRSGTASASFEADGSVFPMDDLPRYRGTTLTVEIPVR